MLSPTPPGHNIEKHNTHSPREHGITIPPLLRLTSLWRTASIETSPKLHPQVSEYWYLLFIKKKKKKKEEGQYLQVSISFIVSHFPAPGVVK